MPIQLIPAATLRQHLADALKEVAGSKKFLLVTKKNRPVSALVDIDFFEDLLAATSPEYLESVREARKEYKAGKLFSHEDVFGRL